MRLVVKGWGATEEATDSAELSRPWEQQGVLPGVSPAPGEAAAYQQLCPRGGLTGKAGQAVEAAGPSSLGPGGVASSHSEVSRELGLTHPFSSTSLFVCDSNETSA